MDDVGTILRTADLTLDEMASILDSEIDLPLRFERNEPRQGSECEWDLLFGK